MSSPHPTSVALIGYRGTGKSHVARLVAARLGWTAVDADDWVETQAGQSIADIFAHSGEAAFRDLETEAVRELTAKSNHVLAMGGGVILREENRQLLAQRSRVFWLTAAPATIAQRISADQSTHTRRPSLTGKSITEEIEEVLSARLPLYKQCANVTIDTDGITPQGVAEAILAQLTDNPAKKEH